MNLSIAEAHTRLSDFLNQFDERGLSGPFGTVMIGRSINRTSLASSTNTDLPDLSDCIDHLPLPDIDGYIHQLAVHTLEGVINPSEPAMFNVPIADTLRVEVRIAPRDNDNVRKNQVALLRFSAFNKTTTPELTEL